MDMEAMSLHGDSYEASGLPQWTRMPIQAAASHVVHINNIDEYLADDNSDTEEGDVAIDINQVTLVETYVNGSLLPMEMHPGETKPRIPECVLQASAEQLRQPKDVRPQTAPTYRDTEPYLPPPCVAADTEDLMEIDG
ncbi:hypothetical protein DFQ29_001473 [Apophysomyces sp. BC1021]|nr:hypothetical protein DFQ29_001473 [Apophysomyces sp. BC1021]